MEQNIFFFFSAIQTIDHWGLLHVSTKLLHVFRSIALSICIKSSMFEIFFFALSNYCWRGLPLGRFFVWFLIRMFCIRLSLAQLMWPAHSNRFAFEKYLNIWYLGFSITFHKVFSSLLILGSWIFIYFYSKVNIVSLRFSVLWIMSFMHTLLSIRDSKWCTISLL